MGDSRLKKKLVDIGTWSVEWHVENLSTCKYVPKTPQHRYLPICTYPLENCNNQGLNKFLIGGKHGGELTR